MMKKMLCLLIFILSSSVLHSKKWFETNYNISLGIMYGNVGACGEPSETAWGINLQIFGLYFDCLVKPRNHGNDVAIDKWKETEAITYHFGYQIPIVQYIRVIPVIGYSSVKTGITDGHNWKDTSNGISNAFYSDKENKGFDYGGVVVLNYKCLCLYGAYTNRNHLYGGLGIEYSF